MLIEPMLEDATSPDGSECVDVTDCCPEVVCWLDGGPVLVGVWSTAGAAVSGVPSASVISSMVRNE